MVDRIQVSKESRSPTLGEDRGKEWNRFKDRIDVSQDSKALDLALKLANDRLDDIEQAREQLQEQAREKGIKIRTSYEP